MINHVFARCSVSTAPGATSSNSTATTPPGESSPPTPAQVLEQARQRVNGDARDNGDGALDTPVGENAPLAPSPVPATNGNGYANGDAQGSEAGEDGEEGARHQLTTNDLFLKDAFLVCRAMCKLTMKPLTTEAERDLRNHATRTKLLSLHMVLSILCVAFYLSCGYALIEVICSFSSRLRPPLCRPPIRVGSLDSRSPHTSINAFISHATHHTLRPPPLLDSTRLHQRTFKSHPSNARPSIRYIHRQPDAPRIPGNNICTSSSRPTRWFGAGADMRLPASSI